VQALPACATVNVWPAIVTAPERPLVLVFAAMFTVTVPAPLPEAPAPIVSQAVVLLDVHVQPPGEVTDTVALWADGTAEYAAGAIAYVHGAPACVTVNVWPATVIVPVRGAFVGLAATATVTVPEAVPLAPDETVSQPAALVALQVQPLAAVTDVVVDWAVASSDRLAGEIAKVQAAPACVTVKVLPAIVMAPDRLVVAVFAAALKPTVPLPVPVAPAVMVSHDAFDTAVQPHVDPAVTLILPVPPPAATLADVVAIVGAQGAVYVNAFDRALTPDPPGPTAAIRAWYSTPEASGDVRRDAKSTRTSPSGWGAGFPRSTDRVTVVLPTV
jgi:hypothetical protein